MGNTIHIVKSHSCLPTIEGPSYLNDLSGPWSDNPCGDSSWVDGECISDFDDLQCATTQGYDDLVACPGSRIEWPDYTIEGPTLDIPDSDDEEQEFYRFSPVVTIPSDDFKLKCPTCDCQLEREWFFGSITGLLEDFPRRLDGVSPACPFFEVEVNSKMSIEGFKWESEFFFDLIDVNAKYNMISYTAYDTNLDYVTLKDKNQVKTTKKCKDEYKETGKSDKDKDDDDRRRDRHRERRRRAKHVKGSTTTSNRLSRNNNNEQPRVLQEFYNPEEPVEEEGTCPFFDGDWVEDGGVSTQTTATEGIRSTEGNISDWDIRMLFIDFDTNDDDTLNCEEVARYVKCEEFETYFGTPTITFLQFKGFFDENF